MHDGVLRSPHKEEAVRSCGLWPLRKATSIKASLGTWNFVQGVESSSFPWSGVEACLRRLNAGTVNPQISETIERLRSSQILTLSASVKSAVSKRIWANSSEIALFY